MFATFAIGMTVINHDLDSGAIVAILAKPVTRLGYAVGKLAAALFLLAAPVLESWAFAADPVELFACDLPARHA